MVDTSKVQGRRRLRFESIDEAVADADRMGQLDRDGRLTALGNWTFGQALGHVATWAEWSYTGPPIKPPFVIKLILRFMKKRFIYEPMKSGAHIPKVPNGTLGIEIIPTDEALRRYRAIAQRLQREAPSKPNVIFGPLTHDEWMKMFLRHSELHLSFFREA